MIYVTQGFVAIFFAVLAYQILKRSRKRLNLIFSSFFISIAIGAIFNMIYAPLQIEWIIKILYFCSIFFIFFGPIFILIVNFIILESTIIFSVKRQNRYILVYGLLIFIGMLILMLIPDPANIFGVTFLEGRPRWSPGFFTYTVTISIIFAVIPIIRTSLKIYSSLETKSLKKKWFYYLIGSLGVLSWAYLLFVTNLIGNDLLRIILSFYGISVIIWVLLMYYGIGFRLKQ